MSKYIDADLLHKEIEGRLNESIELKGIAKRVCPAASPIYEAAEDAYRGLLLFVDHQRQERKEIDLEKEIEEHTVYMPHGEFTSDNEVIEDMEWARKEFRYFYELGLNARKEESK